MHIKNDCKKKPAIPVQKRIKALRPGTVFMYGVYGEAAPYMRCSSGMHLGTAPNDMAVNLDRKSVV